MEKLLQVVTPELFKKRKKFALEHVADSKLRLCYGRGYESRFGKREVLKHLAERRADADFFGINCYF